MSRLAGQVALVTGGGRGIGRGIALQLAGAGMRVAVAARTREQVDATARQVDGLAIGADVSVAADVDRMVGETEQALGPIDLLVNNAGVGGVRRPTWEQAPEEWWGVLEINLLGPFLVCRRVLPGMVERGRGRVVNVASGAAYLPGAGSTSYGASKAGLHRLSELLARELQPHGVRVFSISPGLVRTEMTEPNFPDDAPWTPPELAPRLVQALASGRLDALAGRYLHAEHDDVDDLAARAEQIVRDDLNAIRLRR
ncbi:MAG: SDR family oxidoreductase [Thermoleophilia bacterium]|nr:SDR family oxidoreductase [Thermoleophilia bacterium]